MFEMNESGTGGVERREVVPFVPPTTRLLDVGCGNGAFGALFVDQGTHVHGVEPNPRAAEVAAERLSAVTVGHYPADFPGGSFDCIVFNDVLEHMTDPAAALDAAKGHLAPGGTIVASVPNVRNVDVLAPLILRGRWDYAGWGILDRTHLRFFTKATMRELFESAGYFVERQEAINDGTGSGKRRALRLFGSMSEEFRANQYVIVSRLP
jgi:2-polyprenyl-3-methyl-5-hydroxy-6-metoxy-1,4-benzoquinol methylase